MDRNKTKIRQLAYSSRGKMMTQQDLPVSIL